MDLHVKGKLMPETRHRLPYGTTRPGPSQGARLPLCTARIRCGHV